jgi:hypothetical protein
VYFSWAGMCVDSCPMTPDMHTQYRTHAFNAL